MAVMYLGRIVELGETETLFRAPAHPYTAALLASVPRLVIADDALVSFDPIQGEIPSALSPPPGCHFAPRCPLARDVCRETAPPLKPLSENRPGAPRVAACHFAEDQLAKANAGV
jgi:peptide/nickel transport system ATP-binding protein